jgi:hypothetical protein|tara:strand:- start:38 stop:355 length:318 start_codon:yes stop_codon:yes gene_type:complete
MPLDWIHGMLNGSMVILTHVLQDVAVYGQFLQELQELLLKFGVLEETDTDHAHVTVVKYMQVLKVGTMLQELLILLQDVHIVFVLLVYTVVTQESVRGVVDVCHM